MTCSTDQDIWYGLSSPTELSVQPSGNFTTGPTGPSESVRTGRDSCSVGVACVVKESWIASPSELQDHESPPREVRISEVDTSLQKLTASGKSQPVSRSPHPAGWWWFTDIHDRPQPLVLRDHVARRLLGPRPQSILHVARPFHRTHWGAVIDGCRWNHA